MNFLHKPSEQLAGTTPLAPGPGARTPGPPRGFSLVEVLVAAGIFTIAVLAMVGMWSLQARSIDLARNVLAATTLCEHELESTLAQGFTGAVTRSGTQTLSTLVNGVAVQRSFAYTVTVTLLGSSLKDVVVRVQWSEGGATHEVALEDALAS